MKAMCVLSPGYDHNGFDVHLSNFKSDLLQVKLTCKNQI